MLDTGTKRCYNRDIEQRSRKVSVTRQAKGLFFLDLTKLQKCFIIVLSVDRNRDKVHLQFSVPFSSRSSVAEHPADNR